jgi:acyl-CoA reductase-like NAD-dependent aldehyde dehydrogenase
VGDPSSKETEIGAIISAEQLERVERYLNIGKEEGAVLATGGTRPLAQDHPEDPALAKGWFLQPAVFAGVNNNMRIAREEIFGPVVGVISFKDEDEAVRLANDTQYGLSGSIWTRDIGRAIRVTRRVRAGVLSVNTNSSVHVEAPFGGFKQSGFGRELGMKALDLYTEVKNVFISPD